jgi:hypothetical protein
VYFLKKSVRHSGRSHGPAVGKCSRGDACKFAIKDDTGRHCLMFFRSLLAVSTLRYHVELHSKDNRYDQKLALPLPVSYYEYYVGTTATSYCNYDDYNYDSYGYDHHCY